MNQLDLDRIADNGRFAAGLVQSVGEAALQRSHLWLGDIRGQNLEGSGGGDISDPTPTAALNKRAEEQLAHARIVAAVTAFNTAALTLTNMLSKVTPPAPEKITSEDLGGDWCSSCWRDGKRCEPVALHKDGRVRWAGLCSFCGTFRQTYNALPTVGLLQKHHAGRRLNLDDIKRAGFKDKNEQRAS